MLYMCAAQTVMLVQIGCYTAQNITKMILSASKHKKHGIGGAIMDYADRLDMMDDDCDIQGYPLVDYKCAGCPLDGHCEFVVCREKEGVQHELR